MQGMMTFVRVLPPGQYDEIIRRVQRGETEKMPGMDMREMQHSM
jgi:hypothetical protein